MSAKSADASYGAALLIGVDGGATAAKAHAAERDAAGRLVLRKESAARAYPRIADFEPTPVHEQLAQRAAGRIALTNDEIAQGRSWVAATADAIAEVAAAAGATTVLVGVGMPGLKTPDGDGIEVINNGPRIPQFRAELVETLQARGLNLAAPPPPLQSDADCCGLGEEHAADGLFRDVNDAYYVGGGTGIADALKLGGRLLPLDQAKPWLQKAWQMHSALGPTFEQIVSARALNACFAALVGPNENAFPEQAAAAGDPLAVGVLDAAALALAELICERLVTIKSGRPDAPHRGPAYADLEPQHPYIGTALARVVVGQRIGQLYADPHYRALFADRVDRRLAALLVRSGDAELRAAWLREETTSIEAAALRPGLLLPSKLRAAPALGAAIAAARAQAD